MRMVPKRSCLIWNLKLIQKGISRSDGALVDTNRAVRPVTPLLEEAMPMLIDQGCDLMLKYNMNSLRSRLTMLVVDTIDMSVS